MKSAAAAASSYRHQNPLRSHYSLPKPSPSLIFYSACLTLMLLFFIHLLYYPNTTHDLSTTQINTTQILKQDTREESCDLFKGEWVPDARASLYTNRSCSTIPFMRNCFLHGRRDTHFLHWRWKPDHCQLPPFSPQSFLKALRGKTMAFVGDSLARNQMESLLCLLETVEKPEGTEKDSEGRFGRWAFPAHNFTVMALWSQFLVNASERVVNGSATGGFNLQVDEVDRTWSERLPSMDYVVFSDAHWFFRQNYLYEGGNLVGCVYCQAPNVTDLGPGWAIRRAFRSALKAVNDCRKCRKITATVRTYSPSHFEGGTWNTGGGCNRTTPSGRETVRTEGSDWEYRRIQVEETENARNWGTSEFKVMDVTRMMAMRGDGHPGVHWGNRWMKGYSDCIHWCLPGPIDTWNELLFELIKQPKIRSDQMI